MSVFGEGGKPENPEKNPRSREENQHKLNPLMASGPGIEPGPHWWEASALTTALHHPCFPNFPYATESRKNCSKPPQAGLLHFFHSWFVGASHV